MGLPSTLAYDQAPAATSNHTSVMAVANEEATNQPTVLGSCCVGGEHDSKYGLQLLQRRTAVNVAHKDRFVGLARRVSGHSFDAVHVCKAHKQSNAPAVLMQPAKYITHMATTHLERLHDCHQYEPTITLWWWLSVSVCHFELQTSPLWLS